MSSMRKYTYEEQPALHVFGDSQLLSNARQLDIQGGYRTCSTGLPSLNNEQEMLSSPADDQG
jgi:hypothetical protein